MNESVLPFNLPVSDLLDKFKDKQQIKNYLISLIKNNTITFPIEPPTKEQAVFDFNKLKKTSYKNLLKNGQWFSRYDYDEQYNKVDYYIDLNNDGLKSSDYYHFENRMNCDSINSPSPYRVWATEKFLDTLLNSIFTLKHTHINKSTLKTSFALRKYIASQFRPSAAKCIYELFKPETVFDFSTGWGDRLSAYLGTNDISHYIGTDPNTNLHNGYLEQSLNYGENKYVNIQQLPAEEYDHSDNVKYDLVFTSPPYFNIERYTQDDNQSFKRYRKLDDWLNKFLYKTIDGFYSNLNDGAIIAINMSDVYSNHTINKICDPMNNYLKSLPDMRYLGCIGYRLQKRINSNSDKEGIFCEPVWIWQYKGTKTLMDFIDANNSGIEQLRLF